MGKFIFSVIISFAICLAIGTPLVPFLRKRKAQQTERAELESHQKKTGTPTMGGIMILGAVILTVLFFVIWDSATFMPMLPIALVMLGYGIVGFLDDFLKVELKRSDGLLAWQKMLCQILIAAGFFVYMELNGISQQMVLPFGQKTVVIPLAWRIILYFFCMVGTVNGANFTDGVDGLATTVTIVIAVFLGYVAVSMQCAPEIGPAIGAFLGALFGFLMFNAHPAKVFMGDTGSLALGGFVAATAYYLQMPLVLIIVAFIYLLEVVSVILQVGYFKLTHGKRIFRMAPIHHHFELGGWSEVKVVAVFSIVTALLCLVALWGLGA